MSDHEVVRQIWRLGFDRNTDTLLTLMQHTDVGTFETVPTAVTALLCASRDIPALEEPRRKLVEELRAAWIEMYKSDDWLNRLAEPLGPGPRLRDIIGPRK